MAAVSGWEIRLARWGDALLDAQIVDYDLVRPIKDEMNKTKVFKVCYDPRFIGSSQHDGATHVLAETEASEMLKCLRADIRYLKWCTGVVGHTTVIWSANVEPNCETALLDFTGVVGCHWNDRKGMLRASTTISPICDGSSNGGVLFCERRKSEYFVVSGFD